MKKTLMISFIALFAAIICISCFIKVPIGPIPIVLQNAMCVLTGLLLGGVFGGAPTALFLLAGLIGLPVYSGGTSGIAVWAGPTGGFLPGYLLGAIVAGLIAGRPTVAEKKVSARKVVRISVAMLAGMVIMYIPGTIHFASWAAAAGRVPADKTAFAYTMAACVVPYIPGDLLKTVVGILVAIKVRPVLAQYIYNGKTAASNFNDGSDKVRDK